MEIKTKFNLKDKVYFINNNEVKIATIEAISTFNCGTNQDKITYAGKDFNNPVSWQDHPILHEDKIFLTKEELLNTL